VPPFERLYRDNFPFVWAAARRCGTPLEAVDDVVQDVFVTAYRRASQLDWEVSLRGWLYGVTRRVAFRYRRSAARAARRRQAVAIASTRSEQPHRHHDAAKQVEAMLGRIDVAQREVFEMAELLGMTAPEIAAELGVPLNTVYSRLRLARKRLASLVGSEHAVNDGIAAAREIEAPRQRDAERNWAAIVPVLGAKWPIAVATLSSMVRAPVIAIGIGVIAIAGVVASTGEPSREVAGVNDPEASAIDVQAIETVAKQATAIEPAIVEPAIVEPEPLPEVAASSSPSSSPRDRAARRRPSASASLDVEVALIDAAQSELRKGDAASALRLLDEHALRFPRGQLVEVRSATRVHALCRAGRTAEAEAAIAALQRDFPHSNVARRFGGTCPAS
jgi:RNA polymerase sigma factor (sigma-70 family)